MTVQSEPVVTPNRDPIATVPLRDRAALSAMEAATYLGVGYSTLKKWRSEGIGPRYAKVGAAVLYRPTDLETFVEDRLVGGGQVRRR